MGAVNTSTFLVNYMLPHGAKTPNTITISNRSP